MSLLWFLIGGRVEEGRCCFGFGFIFYSLCSCVSGLSVIWDLFWKLLELGRWVGSGILLASSNFFAFKCSCFLPLLVLHEL